MGSILGTDKYIPTAHHDKDTLPKAFMHIHVILLGIRYYSCEDRDGDTYMCELRVIVHVSNVPNQVWLFKIWN